MKTETFEKAREINSRIFSIEKAIEEVESDKISCSGPAINISFCCPDDNHELKKVVLKHLKDKLKRLQNEFANLK